MAFNGAGIFSRLYSWVADAAAGIKIKSDRMDAEMDGFATGLTKAICKDGQSTTTAAIPFAVGIHITGGQLLMDTQPSFLAYRATDTANATGNGATATVNFSTEVFDRAANFSGTTFTAPVTGIYGFSASVLLGDLTTAMTSFTLNLVTTARIYQKKIDFTPIAGGVISLDISVLADMTAADTAVVQIIASNGAGDTADIKGSSNLATFFSGQLVA